MEFVSGGDTLFAEIVEPPALRANASALPVVLLHPTPLAHRFWSPMLPALAGYRLVLPDLRGHGRSALGEAPLGDGSATPVLTVSQLAHDSIALLDALDIAKAIFVGCSIGGYTLFELWRIAPERMAAAVFCASKPQADTDAERSRRAVWIEKHERQRVLGSPGPTSEFLESMLGTLLSAETHARQPSTVAAARAMMEQVRPGAIQAIQRGLAARPDSRPTAASFTIPTCVLAGEQDPSSRPEDMSALHALLGQFGAPTEYHLIPQAAHYLAMEQPVASGAIVAAFCNNMLTMSSR